MHNSIQTENIRLWTLDIKCSFVYLNFVLFQIIQKRAFIAYFAF